eukprot:g29007.t1
MVEGLRLQALARHARISDLFRGCGVSWEKRLSFKAFSNLLEKLQIKCEEHMGDRRSPRDAFDFLDVRSCGTISLREVVATLQNVMPGTKDWHVLWECDRKAEKDGGNVQSKGDGEALSPTLKQRRRSSSFYLRQLLGDLRSARQDVRAYLAPLHRTVTQLKTTMKQDIEEDAPPSPVIYTASPRSRMEGAAEEGNWCIYRFVPP